MQQIDNLGFGDGTRSNNSPYPVQGCNPVQLNAAYADYTPY